MSFNRNVYRIHTCNNFCTDWHSHGQQQGGVPLSHGHKLRMRSPSWARKLLHFSVSLVISMNRLVKFPAVCYPKINTWHSAQRNSKGRAAGIARLLTVEFKVPNSPVPGFAFTHYYWTLSADVCPSRGEKDHSPAYEYWSGKSTSTLKHISHAKTLFFFKFLLLLLLYSSRLTAS